MNRKWTTAGLALLGFLLNYLLWGLLDEAGGVKALTESASAFAQALPSYLSTPVCFPPTLSEGCFSFPISLWLLASIPTVIFALAFVLSKLFDALTDSGYDRRTKEGAEQYKLILSAVRQALREEKEREKRKGGD